MSVLTLVLLIIAGAIAWRWLSGGMTQTRRDVSNTPGADPMTSNRQDAEFGEETDLFRSPLAINAEASVVEKPRKVGWEAKTNGVSVTRSGGRAEGGSDILGINYHGLLVNDGADGVLVRYGRDGWQDVKDAWMEKQPDGSFAATLKDTSKKELNLCFKDTADHFDNNNGWNWSTGMK